MDGPPKRDPTGTKISSRGVLRVMMINVKVETKKAKCIRCDESNSDWV